MPFILTDAERRVLECFKCHEGFWLRTHFPRLATAAGDADRAKEICKGLRRRKLLDIDGRGRLAGYAISEKGIKALAQPAMTAVREVPGPPNPPRSDRHRPVG